MATRVLQVCPFDIPEEPSAGGQIRIEAIAQAYRDAGCVVDRCCIVTRKRDARRPHDLMMSWLDRIRRKHLGKPSNLGQIRQHWAAMSGRHLQKQLAARLTHAYDIVHVEHPWGMQLVQSMAQHPQLAGAKIVYSAHNIEWELFESVTREQGHWNQSAQKLAREIAHIEHMAAASADFTWVVSHADAAKLQPHTQHCIVAPNGCRALPTRRPPTPFQTTGQRHALFIGANYAPNINGFLHMLGDDLSFLPEGTVIHTIGTCAQALQQHPPHRQWLASGRLHHHGKVSADMLDAALLHADVVLLPILSGGGTNLKTAEALASSRPVLGTTKAFRGFEDWMTAPGVHIADEPLSFRDKLAKLLSTTEPAPTTSRHQDLTWSAALMPALAATLPDSIHSGATS